MGYWANVPSATDQPVWPVPETYRAQFPETVTGSSVESRLKAFLATADATVPVRIGFYKLRGMTLANQVPYWQFDKRAAMMNLTPANHPDLPGFPIPGAAPADVLETIALMAADPTTSGVVTADTIVAAVVQGTVTMDQVAVVVGVGATELSQAVAATASNPVADAGDQMWSVDPDNQSIEAAQDSLRWTPPQAPEFHLQGGPDPMGYYEWLSRDGYTVHTRFPLDRLDRVQGIVYLSDHTPPLGGEMIPLTALRTAIINAFKDGSGHDDALAGLLAHARETYLPQSLERALGLDSAGKTALFQFTAGMSPYNDSYWLGRVADAEAAYTQAQIDALYQLHNTVSWIKDKIIYYKTNFPAWGFEATADEMRRAYDTTKLKFSIAARELKLDATNWPALIEAVPVDHTGDPAWPAGGGHDNTPDFTAEEWAAYQATHDAQEAAEDQAAADAQALHDAQSTRVNSKGFTQLAWLAFKDGLQLTPTQLQNLIAYEVLRRPFDFAYGPNSMTTMARKWYGLELSDLIGALASIGVAKNSSDTAWVWPNKAAWESTITLYTDGELSNYLDTFFDDHPTWCVYDALVVALRNAIPVADFAKALTILGGVMPSDKSYGKRPDGTVGTINYGDVHYVNNAGQTLIGNGTIGLTVQAADGVTEVEVPQEAAVAAVPGVDVVVTTDPVDDDIVTGGEWWTLPPADQLEWTKTQIVYYRGTNPEVGYTEFRALALGMPHMTPALYDAALTALGLNAVNWFATEDADDGTITTPSSTASFWAKAATALTILSFLH